MSQWSLMEFACPEHGRFESTELRADAPDDKPCPECGDASPWVISTPMVRKLSIKVQAVTTAKSDPRPPGMLDTRKLGLEGQSMSDWNKERNAEDRETRHQWIKKNVGT